MKLISYCKIRFMQFEYKPGTSQQKQLLPTKVPTVVVPELAPMQSEIASGRYIL